jgi:hypothetical protein
MASCAGGARKGMPDVATESSPSLQDVLLAQLPASPDAYPQKLDLVRESVLVVRLDEPAYRAASFLDDRILGPSLQGAWIGLGRVAEAARHATGTRPLHFIFHTGHVGSTLVSRLLDETGAVLSLREPLPLRTLAEARDVLDRPDSLLSHAQFDSALGVFATLWSRGYRTTRGVVVKATSSAGRIAGPILERHAASRAIYLNVDAEPYLATLLAGQNSPLDLRGHGAERIRRLGASVTAPLPPLHAMSIGELAAMSWLVESRAQRDAVAAFPDRVIALDFDRFLASVAQSMGRILGHFGVQADPRYLTTVGQSPVLTRYSKAPEYAYTPQVRAEILRDARRDHSEEIARGLAWLERLARSNPAIADLVTSSTTFG